MLEQIAGVTALAVCSYDMLGQYASQLAKTPPIECKNPAEDQSTKIQQKKSSAVETSQTDTVQTDGVSKAPTAPLEQDFTADWQVARKLFWGKDNEAALAAYEKLVQARPDNTQLRVELGNVLYKKGDVAKAAETYFAAGEQFKRQKTTPKLLKSKRFWRKLHQKKPNNLKRCQNKKHCGNSWRAQNHFLFESFEKMNMIAKIDAGARMVQACQSEVTNEKEVR